MERLEYVGVDPRLDYGTIYDCTVKKEQGGQGPVYLSVHTGLHTRIYFNYASRTEYRTDWIEREKKDHGGYN